MKSITERFLRSIKIEDIDLFDFDIVSTQKDKSNKFIFTFLKKTPWNYDLLEYFLEQLNNITYNYKIIFIYEISISIESITLLLKDFINKKARNSDSFLIKNNNGVINLYISETEQINSKLFLSDFESLLNYINYPKTIILLSPLKKESISNFVNSSSQDITNSTNVKISEDNDKSFESEEQFNEKDFENESEYDEDFDGFENDADFQYFEDETESDDDYITTSNDDVYLKRDEQISNSIENASKKILQNIDEKNKLFEGLDTKYDYVPTSIGQINSEKMYVLSRGYVYSNTSKEIRGVTKFTILVNDGKDSIFIEISAKKHDEIEYLSSLKVKTCLKFTGISYLNKFLRNSIVVKVTSYVEDGSYPLRSDNCEYGKRVELHAHSKMSTMDGVGIVDDYFKEAAAMGHKAFALCDHASVQAYPDVQKAAKKYGVKALYGCELYVVDDDFICAFNPNDQKLSDATFVVFDLETTGLSTRYDKILEFAGFKVRNGMIIDKKDILINPEEELSTHISNLTNITNDMLKNEKPIKDCIEEIYDFIKGCVLVSHNLEFDYNHLRNKLKEIKNIDLDVPGIDTLNLDRYLYPEHAAHALGNVCHRFKVRYDKKDAHRADYDAQVLTDCWLLYLDILKDKGFEDVKSLETLKKEVKHYKVSREYHVNAIVKNSDGLRDLYKLISFAHTKYFGRVPCVPRSVLKEYRKNLLLGSACFNGEVFNKVAYTGTKQSVIEAIDFYDFIEIQPLENYRSLIETYSISKKEYLLKFLNEIIEISNENGKLICATDDAHYVNKEDKIFRDIYIYSAGVGKTAHPLYTREKRELEEKGIFLENPDQHFRNTEEMLEEFEIFGKENAIKWVITNTNKIADMCEEIYPIKDKLFTPHIENCEKMLSDICFENAKNLYGDPLPKLIEDRLKRELDGIIGNGYSVIYYIAHKIIKKIHEDGYIVGSRGSVGSSFVATMANITEVNPLPPHYRCPKCKHFEVYEGNEYNSGYDLPKKYCPVCGKLMVSDGQNIPFETFLGFNADKVPDIDLNFPPDYQARAHDYTKVLLGENNVFRAGTIGTVAEKTAFGYVKGYYERRYGITDSNQVSYAKLNYLAFNCQDVKRTTGQHPGGIIVIPDGFEVYDFTPIQFPADEIDFSWKTTHFEFKAIHDTVLKLDLLGHKDPQALKFMVDLTGVKLEDIQLNDEKIMSLFKNTSALNYKHNYLKLNNGVLGLPEFGTNFVIGLIESTQPQTFAEILIISGLSHGKGVWLGNAESLVKSHLTDLKGVIGCRDDIMVTLINKYNLPPLDSFKIMECVRKGKGLTLEQEKLMRDNNVPDYYIESCKKIKYLFPKAHATAYVTNSLRVAYFKIYYPLVYYACFLSIRSENFDWDSMRKGPEAMFAKIEEIHDLKKNKPSEYSKTDENVERTLEISLEMMDRGFSFENIDLYKSDATNFVVDYEKNALIPPFKVIAGLGDNAAISIIEARKNGNFTSVEDLMKRTKLNNTHIQVFKELGILKDLPEKNREQLSLFDMFSF